MGGENSPVEGVPLEDVGSSPRGRGKPTTTAQDSPKPPAHPRVGGENSVLSYRASLGIGSSPRGRGKLTGGFEGDFDHGLIPAWAGKTATPVM